ncbi:tail fiber protein [Alcanivorax sp.]|jgi:microcystin-dependent protein|uniref:phage tail protein n=1 Tax=Alcanivorax sp. TaxID=1872427 RepID=UPI000C611AA9|nr:phage tail protein [Alcanivorax sp.]|tara:strand:+ start:195 stop:596 length:402 start_codon:yes stop_codon:yes gene_type:complete
MSEPFLAEIRIYGFNFAPRGWAFCDGQILPINQNQSLYSLLGTTYGGDGRTSFALPDLRGRTPMHLASGNISQGSKGGTLSDTDDGETLDSLTLDRNLDSTLNSTPVATQGAQMPTIALNFAIALQGIFPPRS